MYAASPDPYCYPGTRVLRNLADLRRQSDLDSYELALTTQRFAEGLPRGRQSVSHYCTIHRHLFQDVYSWAGKYRTVRLSKGTSTFCYPENVDAQMKKLFAELKRKRYLRQSALIEFAREAAHFLAELNAIHPFRDGNGRTQLAFTTLLAVQAGFALDLRRIRRRRFLAAMIASFNGNENLLTEELYELIK